MKKYDFFQKNFRSSKCSYGHVEFIFDSPVENFGTQGQKFYAQYPKLVKNMQAFQKKFLLQIVAIDT